MTHLQLLSWWVNYTMKQGRWAGQLTLDLIWILCITRGSCNVRFSSCANRADYYPEKSQQMSAGVLWCFFHANAGQRSKRLQVSLLLCVLFCLPVYCFPIFFCWYYRHIQIHLVLMSKQYRQRFMHHVLPPACSAQAPPLPWHQTEVPGGENASGADKVWKCKMRKWLLKQSESILYTGMFS